MKKIMIVGSLNSDITVYAPRFPVPGETIIGGRVGFGYGGKGSNQAIAAHRSGGLVKFVSRVGGDALGGDLLAFYRSEGISTEYISVSETTATGCAIIEVSAETGNNHIVVAQGANAELSAEEIAAAEKDFADCDVFLTQLETSLDSIAEGRRLALKYGKPIVFNPAPYAALPDGFFEGIDFVTPNETEAEYYTGETVNDIDGARRAARAFMKMGVRNVIITLGKRGAFFSGEHGELLVPTTDLKAVDTTGAGDSFNGAFCVGYAEGMDVETALKFANCVSSISVTRRGAATSIPHREEALALLSGYYNVTLD